METIMKEDDIFELIRGMRIREKNAGEYRIDDVAARKMAHELYIEEEEKNNG